MNVINSVQVLHPFIYLLHMTQRTEIYEHTWSRCSPHLSGRRDRYA